MPPAGRRKSSDLIRELLNRLSRDVRDESCVLFVGGGSTTEKWSRRHNFYSKIKDMIAVGESGNALSFPDVMQMFCEQRDGGHHNLLIREAIGYLEPFLLPGPAYSSANEFCSILATIPCLKTVVTTNWDPLLERALDVLVPVTEDRDLAFWDERKKQVLKLHGCITKPHSIVATRTDYENCIAANTLLFNKLRDLMATRTFLFTGYSLRDGDFRDIWESITSRLGRFAKLAYALDPFASDADAEFWKERGILIFRVSDVHFIEELRQHLVDLGLIPSEGLVNFLMRERRRLGRIHSQNRQDSDGAFSSAMYQDGVLHQLDDILSGVQLGTMKHQDVENELGWVLNTMRKMQRKRDPIEIAYWSGRYSALQAYFEENRSAIPAYFHPYRLQPLHRLVKGSTWRPSRFKAGETAPVENAGADADDSFFAVCKECAQKLHAPRSKSAHQGA